MKTGNTAFDGIATVAAQSGSSVETAQKRWGNAGVNYFANLNAAGRGYGDQKIPGTDRLLTPKKQWK